MDFHQFGIDERLLSGVPSLRDQALYHEKMLTHALKQRENVYARISVAKGREAIYLLPALQWVISGEASQPRRVLCLVPDAPTARKSADMARAIGSGIGLEACMVSLEGEGQAPTEAGSGAAGLAAPILEGSPGAAFVAGSLEALLAASSLLDLRSFGFLIIDGAELIADLPSERIRHLSAALLPSWERRTVVTCGRATVKAKNLAWDLSENPVEFHIEEEAAKAQSVAQESWHIASDAKLRFLLGLLARHKPSRCCVFCNLRSGAEELALRLRYDGVETSLVLGSLPAGRKAEILSEIEAEPGSVLVLTDEGAVGMKAGSFPLVVNYDIPLDPELYVRRLEMLDRAGASSGIVNLACDRYVYGLPAVEQYIDAKLDTRPVDGSLLLAEDKSAGFVFEQPRSDQDGPRDALRAGRLVAAEGHRPAASADGHGRPDSRGRGRPEGQGRGRQDAARPDRSPDIRRRIAEATGGSIDVDGRSREGSPAGGTGKPTGAGRSGKQGKPSPKASQPQGRKGGEARKASPQGNGGGSGQHPQRGNGRRQGQEEQRRGGKQSRQGPPRGQPASQGGQRANAQPNPYDLSMEERMQRYREKYGQDAAGRANGRANGKANGKDGKPASARSNVQGGQRKPLGGKKPEGRAGQDGKGREEPRSQGQSRQPARKAAPEPRKPAAQPAKPGLIARLFGGKRSKGA